MAYAHDNLDLDAVVKLRIDAIHSGPASNVVVTICDGLCLDWGWYGPARVNQFWTDYHDGYTTTQTLALTFSDCYMAPGVSPQIDPALQDGHYRFDGYSYCTPLLEAPVWRLPCNLRLAPLQWRNDLGSQSWNSLPLSMGGGMQTEYLCRNLSDTTGILTAPTALVGEFSTLRVQWQRRRYAAPSAHGVWEHLVWTVDGITVLDATCDSDGLAASRGNATTTGWQFQGGVGHVVDWRDAPRDLLGYTVGADDDPTFGDGWLPSYGTSPPWSPTGTYSDPTFNHAWARPKPAVNAVGADVTVGAMQLVVNGLVKYDYAGPSFAWAAGLPPAGASYESTLGEPRCVDVAEGTRLAGATDYTQPLVAWRGRSDGCGARPGLLRGPVACASLVAQANWPRRVEIADWESWWGVTGYEPGAGYPLASRLCADARTAWGKTGNYWHRALSPYITYPTMANLVPIPSGRMVDSPGVGIVDTWAPTAYDSSFPLALTALGRALAAQASAHIPADGAAVPPNLSTEGDVGRVLPGGWYGVGGWPNWLPFSLAPLRDGVWTWSQASTDALRGTDSGGLWTHPQVAEVYASPPYAVVPTATFGAAPDRRPPGAECALCIDPILDAPIAVGLREVLTGSGSTATYGVSLWRMNLCELDDDGLPYPLADVVDLGSATDPVVGWCLADAVMSRHGTLWVALWAVHVNSQAALVCYRMAPDDTEATPVYTSSAADVPAMMAARLAPDPCTGEVLLWSLSADGATLNAVSLGAGDPVVFSVPAPALVPTPPYGGWLEGSVQTPILLWAFCEVSGRYRLRFNVRGLYDSRGTFSAPPSAAREDAGCCGVFAFGDVVDVVTDSDPVAGFATMAVEDPQ
jgi:hypothetical protein